MVVRNRDGVRPAEAPRHLPRVEIRPPGEAAQQLEIHGPLEVGRDCDGVAVSDPNVSRRHLRLTPAGEALSVVDLGSTNGTTLNGAPVTREALLQPGDVIRLGSVEIAVLGPPSPPPPAPP